MSSPDYRFGEFTLSADRRELRRASAPLALSPRAFDCLVYLIEHRDRAVGKDELVAAIWHRLDVSDTQLGQTVLRARRAIDDDGQAQRAIRTVPRFGYRWVGDVCVVDYGVDASTHLVSKPTPSVPTVTEPQANDSSVVAAISPSPRRRKASMIGAVGLITVIVAALALIGLKRATRPEISQPRTTSAAVLPVEVDAGADHAWLRLGAMDLIAERLRDGGLAVPASDSIVGLLQQVRHDQPIDEDTRVRAATHSALVVGTHLALRDQHWLAVMRARATDGTTLEVKADRDDALDAARDASDRLLARLGRPRLPPATHATGLQQRLQQAQAAMLANDLDAARAILIGDPDLARAEPQLGYRLAQVDFRAGDYAHADSALGALLSEAAANEPLFRARLLNARGAVRIREDDFNGAERDYDAAISLLGGGAHAAERGLALTGRGVARSIHHDFSAALADLGEARVELQAAGDALAVARVDSNLGGLEMNRDRPAQALPYLDSAAETFERYGAINELMETLESLVSDNLALLRPIDALAASDRSWALAARVTDRNQRVDLRLDRVDAFLALGRLRDAGALLAGLPARLPATHPFVARRLPALRARLAWLEGRNDDAATAARAALALPAPADDGGEGVAEIALVLQRATLAAESVTPATAPAEHWLPIASIDAYPVQAVLKAEWADASGDEVGAERSYQSARELAERHGVPSDIALVAASYGPWLLRRDRFELAAEVIGRVAPWASSDFDCALLQALLFRALGNSDAAAVAWLQTRALAGERHLPAALLSVQG